MKQGIDCTNEQIGKIEQLLNEYIDFAAQEAGIRTADKANQVQEKAIREAMNAANRAIKRVSNIALAMVNKAILQLMAVIGG